MEKKQKSLWILISTEREREREREAPVLNFPLLLPPPLSPSRIHRYFLQVEIFPSSRDGDEEEGEERKWPKIFDGLD